MATKNAYCGKERRSAKACPLHPQLVEQHRQTDEKVTALGTQNEIIIANQNTYMTTTDNLVKLVTNGLKTKVDEVAQTMAEIKLRSDTVDTFQWFITLANSFKEKLAINVIKIMAVGGILAFIWSFMSSGGSKVGEAILKAIIK